MIGRLRRRFSGMLRQLMLPVWKLRGTEKNSGGPMTLIYAGVERHKNHFLAFAEGAEEALLGTWPAWSLRGRLASLDADLRVVEVNALMEKFYPTAGEIRIPVWVWATCDLSGGREFFETSGRYRTHRQRVRQHGVEYKLWTGEDALKDFYENMYLPYTSYRHSDSTFAYGFDEVRAKFLAGQLGGLEKEGVPVVAQVTSLNGGSAHAFVMGVRKGHEELLRKGILEVFNYFTMIQLAEKGCTALDLGYSRGFLRDGVLQNKFRNGAKLNGRIHEESGHLIYTVVRRTEALESFLVNNPVILSENGGLWAGYFAGKGQAPAEELRERAKDLREEGFEGVKLIDHSPAGRGLEARTLS